MYRMLPKEQESRGVHGEEGYPLNKTLTEHLLCARTDARHQEFRNESNMVTAVKGL